MILIITALITIQNHLAVLSSSALPDLTIPIPSLTSSRLTSTMSPPFGYREPKPADINWSTYVEICGFLTLFTPIVKHADMSRTDPPSGGEEHRAPALVSKAAACIAGQGIM